MERKVFGRLALEDYQSQNCKWFLEPEYVPHKVTAGKKYIDHEKAAELVLMRQRDPLVRCESLGKIC